MQSDYMPIDSTRINYQSLKHTHTQTHAHNVQFIFKSKDSHLFDDDVSQFLKASTESVSCRRPNSDTTLSVSRH
jgi:hypothetical protein